MLIEIKQFFYENIFLSLVPAKLRQSKLSSCEKSWIIWYLYVSFNLVWLLISYKNINKLDIIGSIEQTTRIEVFWMLQTVLNDWLKLLKIGEFEGFQISSRFRMKLNVESKFEMLSLTVQRTWLKGFLVKMRSWLKWDPG